MMLNIGVLLILIEVFKYIRLKRFVVIQIFDDGEIGIYSKARTMEEAERLKAQAENFHIHSGITKDWVRLDGSESKIIKFRIMEVG